MRNILFLISVLFTTGACNLKDSSGEKQLSIEGKLENSSVSFLRIEELTTKDLVLVDSIPVDDQGRFSYQQNISQSGFYIIRADKTNFITLLIEPGESIHIAADANDFSGSLIIKGSDGSKKLLSLNKSISSGLSKVDSLVQYLSENRSNPEYKEIKIEMDSVYADIFYSKQEFVKEFIEQNPRSLASIIALYKYFGNQLLLNEKEHFEYFENLSESLYGVYPDNKHVTDLRRRVIEYKRKEMNRQLVESKLAPGNPAPEILLPDPEGKPVALSSLRGNVVLIDFWAAWCPPCRQHNPRLAELYNKYKQHGFEIYAISLDRTRQQWISGIKEDEISWIQVSDLRFWNSPVVELYNVESIPYTILIDREGNIVEKGVDIDKLEELLKETLEKSPV